METVQYTCTNAWYRLNNGGWWSPLSGGRVPTGWNADGSNKYETRLQFPFSTIRSRYASESIAAARFKFRQTNEYTAKTVLTRVTTSSYVAIAGGSSGASKVNDWATINLSSAMAAALVDGSSAYFGTYGNANGTYIEFYGTGANAPILEIDWVPREPAPTPPIVPSFPSINSQNHTFTCGEVTDQSGIFSPSQIAVEMQISLDGGANWGSTYTTAAGVRQVTVDMWAYVGYTAGTNYYNNNCKVRFRAKTPQYEGNYYYSAWTERAFYVDYRYSPNLPVLTAPGTIKTGTYLFDWSDVGSVNGYYSASQTVYEFRLSVNGGSTWGGAISTAAGTSQISVNLLSYIGLLSGQYYYNDNCKISVRGKSPNNHYSSWRVLDGTFAIDFRVAPSAPTSLTPSKSDPYEGEDITFTIGRPATYNAYDSAGNTNTLAYRVARAGGVVLDLETFPVTTATPVLNYTVGDMTTGKSDLSTEIYAYAQDSEGQWSPQTARQAFTVKRYRAPSVIISDIDRGTDSATVHVLVTDTGYGGEQSNSQIKEIEYNLDGGGWTTASLGSWNGLYNSFTLTGLDAGTRYPLLVRAVSNAPAGTSLSDKTGAAYEGAILELIPASGAFKDPGTGVRGHYAQSLRVGADPRKAAYIEDFTGWTHPNHAWTYASATTFTVAGNVTATYYMGVKIRYKQGGSYEYGTVKSSSYSAPNTTVTLFDNNDYALAKDTITDNYISLAERPAGFPAHFSFTPYLVGHSTAGVFTYTTQEGWFIVNGCAVHIHIRIDVAGVTTPAAGYPRIYGLPAALAPANIQTIHLGCRYLKLAGIPLGYFPAASNTIQIYGQVDNGALGVPDAATITGNTEIWVDGTIFLV